MNPEITKSNIKQDAQTLSVVAQKMSVMSRNLDQLREAIMRLFDALEPILQVEPITAINSKANETAADKIAATDCPLAIALDINNEKISSLTERVNTITRLRQV